MSTSTIDVPDYVGLPLAQGDLMVIPAGGLVPEATANVPAGGVPLVRGNGGHVHLLLGDGILWKPGRDGAQTVGTITVPEGCTGYLAHGDGSPGSLSAGQADHAPLAFGPGTYVVRRQREQADEIRLVED